MDKEQYILDKLGQLGAVRQDERRAEENLRQVREAVEAQSAAPGHAGRMSFRIAAGVLLAAGLLIAFGPRWANHGSVAWAEIVEQFRAMPFYNAVMYFKEDAAAEPKQIELWVSSAHKARVRIGDQVLFADQGKVVAGYDFRRRATLDPSEYDEMGVGIIMRLCQRPQLSLEHVVQMICRGRLEDMTPVINSDAMIARDLLVFDIVSDAAPDWMRIWALRESRLPVRLRMWDPRDGECMDAFITYDRQQPAEFFDPARYGTLLRETGYNEAGSANMAYALLRDAGGRDYVPRDLFDKSGYHVPVVEQVGITPDGAVWVVASHARNQMPNGNPFEGFASVTDDLGRAYKRMENRYEFRGDTSIQIFVPEEFPFDPRVPARLTLTCEVDNPLRMPREVIGTVEVTDWQTHAMWPVGRIGTTLNTLLLRAAEQYIGKKEFDKVDAIAQRIAASPEADQLAHKLNRLELKKRIKQERFVEADELAEAMWDDEMKIFLNPGQDYPSIYPFADLIIAIAGNGRVDRAAELWKELKAAEPDLSSRSKGAQQRMREKIREQFTNAYFAYEMASVNGLDVEAINRILGYDVMANEKTKGLVQSMLNQRKRAAAAESARQYLESLAKRYETHPLPEQMELVPRDTESKVYLVHVSNTLPGHEDYKVQLFNITVRQVAFSLRFSMKAYPEYLVVTEIDEALSPELLETKVYADLVYRKDILPLERYEYVLKEYGLKVVKGEGEARTVWVVRYNGKPLADFRKVRAPYPNMTGSIIGAKPGTMGSYNVDGMSVGAHLTQLHHIQNQDVQDETKRMIFLDETGLEEPISVEVATWPGEEGFAQARTWFEEQFGITFTQEERLLPVLRVEGK